MRSSNRPLARLGLALTAALLGLATATAAATADPTGTEPPTSTETTSTETPSDPETPTESSTESPTPKESEPPAVASIEDIDVTAAFDKPSYVTSEDMAITLTVTNTGAEPLTMYAYFPHRTTGDGIVVTATSTFRPNESFTLAGGASITNVLTGRTVNPKFPTGTLHVSVNAGEWRNFDFTVPVTPKAVPVSGTVFDDVNGNGSIDDGEGAGGATLVLRREENDLYRVEVTPNSAGEFSLDVSPGTYDVYGESHGFMIVPRTVVVPASGVDGVLVKALRKLSDLTVDIDIAKDTYTPHETPTVRVTLTNKSAKPMTDIIASCDNWPGTPNLTGDSWGIPNGGMIIAPHSTVVLDGTEPMPERAYDHGYVGIDCIFGHAGAPYAESNPRDADYAKVPGQFIDVNGQVTTIVGGVGVAGWRFVLTEVGGCPVVGEAVSNANGEFTIKHVPAGRYFLYVVPTPGWTFKGAWVPPAPIPLAAGDGTFLTYLAAPTSQPSGATPPPDCPGGPTNPPGPQGSATPGLAATGASLVLPGIAGLLAVLAGTAALLLTRRRRTA